MTDDSLQPEQKLSWRFPRMFWIANTAELFERAAFYGAFIALAVYLTREIGFTDRGAALVAALFSSVLYLLPTFMGAMADKIGFRRALILAFALLTVGYFLLGAAPEVGGLLTAAQAVKVTAVASLGLIMFGGAIIKPVISGTVAQCSDDAHRVRAFSIFYQVVNIGAFVGKSMAKPLRTGFDMPYFGHLELGLQYINYYAATMAFIALIWIVLFYRNVDTTGTSKSVDQILAGFVKVLTNFRFMALIVIVAGFWAIQGQLYATMPKYMLRLMGEGAKPEWLANINPFVVVVLVVPITHVIRHFKPENAIGVGLFIIPMSALCIGISPWVESATGSSISFFGLTTMHPITMMVIIGIALQGLAECFLSPKFLEYASKQAPEGEVGLYLGYQHLTTCIAWLFGFILSGELLTRYCPNPAELPPDVSAQYQAAIEAGTALPEAYANAHYIWFVYSGVGVSALVGLIIFKIVTGMIDRSRAA